MTYRMSKWETIIWGNAEMWDEVGAMRKDPQTISESDIRKRVGGEAFYGRSWIFRRKNVYRKDEDTMITIQLDMFLAERFDMSYVDKDSEKKRPYIIHQYLYGVLDERTLAWLIEKYEGAFPTWLCQNR